MIIVGHSSQNESAIYDHLRDTDDMDPVDRALARYVLNPDYRYEIHSVIDDALEEYGNDSAMTIYRGLNFDTEEDYNKFMRQGSNLKLKDISSWSPDKREAETFAITKPSYMEFMTREKMAMISAQRKSGERITGYRGVILKTRIKPGQGIDLRKFKHHSESEILLPPGRYKVSCELVLSYKDQFKNTNPSDKILKMTKSNKESAKVLEYVMKNYKPEDLSDEARHKIYLLTTEASKLGKYYVKVREPSEWTMEKHRVIDVGMVTPNKEYLPWYTSDDRDKILKAMKSQFKKMIKEVFSHYVSGAEIKWFNDHQYWARFCQADDELTKAERATLKKEYDKQDQIVKDINKIKDPKAQRAAIDAEIERMKKIIGSI